MSKNLFVQLDGNNDFMITTSTRVLYASPNARRHTANPGAGIPLDKALQRKVVFGYSWRNGVHKRFLEWYHYNINNLENCHV